MRQLFFLTLLSLLTDMVQSSADSFQPRFGQWYPIYKNSAEGQDLVSRALKVYEEQRETKVLHYSVLYIYAQASNGMNYLISMELEECKSNTFPRKRSSDCELLTLSCVFGISDVTSKMFNLNAKCQKKSF